MPCRKRQVKRRIWPNRRRRAQIQEAALFFYAGTGCFAVQAKATGYMISVCADIRCKANPHGLIPYGFSYWAWWWLAVKLCFFDHLANDGIGIIVAYTIVLVTAWFSSGGWSAPRCFLLVAFLLNNSSPTAHAHHHHTHTHSHKHILQPNWFLSDAWWVHATLRWFFFLKK